MYVTSEAMHTNEPIDHQANAIPRLIGERLLERLTWFEAFKPATILELGCGTGDDLSLLQHHYPSAQFWGLDSKHENLVQTQQKTHHSQHSPYLIAGDLEHPLFKPEQFNLIWANLSLSWLSDPKAYLAFLYTLLKPGGLLLISVLGPDSFHILRTTSDTHPLIHYPWAFCDMHQVGDALVAAQFQHIVMDVDYLTVHYDNLELGYQELKQLGFDTLLPQFNNQIQHDAPASLTWEVIYGQAWKPMTVPIQDKSEVVIPIQDLQRPYLLNRLSS